MSRYQEIRAIFNKCDELDKAIISLEKMLEFSTNHSNCHMEIGVFREASIKNEILKIDYALHQSILNELIYNLESRKKYILKSIDSYLKEPLDE